MPRLRFAVTVYECPRCGARIRERVGRAITCIDREAHGPEPEPAETVMMQTIIGPRPNPVQPQQSRWWEVSMVDIGPVSDKSLDPVLGRVWLAA